MVSYAFTYDNLLYALLILARIASFVAVAPLIGGNNTGVSNAVKVAFAVFFSAMLYGVVPRAALDYDSVFGYSVIVLKEVFCGIAIGLAAQLCMQVTSFAGHIVDMMSGLSMVTQMDPTSGNQVTITGTIYNQVIMAMLVVSGMYRYLFMAIADSYAWVPVNGAVFHEQAIVLSMFDFLKNFFIIGFRVALPVFLVTFTINIVLGVLAKVAPQMNMFSVGIQIKILTGMAILYLSARMLGAAADFILRNMRILMEQFIRAMSAV